MKARAYTILGALLIAGLAHAGFQHPVEEAGSVASREIERGSAHDSSSTASIRRVMPDRMEARPSAPSANSASSAKALPAGKAAPAAKTAATLPPFRGPVPKAPALPASERIGIPTVMLPRAGDGIITMAPEKLDLRGLNRPQIHAFLRHARRLPLPQREFTREVRSRAVAEHYRAALHPVPGKSFRTAWSLSLAKVGKIPQPPSATQYENMVKRIDSLFLGLDLRYPKAVMGLWQLAGSETNERALQARDALFAGLLSNRAGWETTGSMLLEEAASKNVAREDRYLRILWGQLEGVQNPVHLDRIVRAVSPLRARDVSPEGDRANFSMAKRLLTSHARVPAAPWPSHEAFAQRIASPALRDKLTILRSLAGLRGKEPDRAAAVEALRGIEAAGSEDNRQQARLALARALLQRGSAAEALEHYRNVRKDGKNRLNVLGEQTYAEYASGAYQDALGKAVALQTPYFQYGFAPDVHLVEILTRKATCDFGGAEAGVKRFVERYAPELRALEETLAQKPDAGAYYERLVGFADLEQPMRHQRYLLQLPGVMENQKTMNSALGELKKLDEVGLKQKSVERPEGWDGFAVSMRQRWSGEARNLRGESAAEALREAAYLAQRLRHTFAQVELLDLDISTAAAKNYNLQSALNFPAHRQEAAKIDDEKLRWPFETEIWEDEIDYMKAKNPSKCAVSASL